MSRLRAPEIFVAAGQKSFRNFIAREFARAAKKAIRERGRFVAALSGGKTPKEILPLLVRPAFKDRIPWSRVFVFWVDERCVAPQDRLSNFRMVNDVLLSRVPIPPENIFRMPGETMPRRDGAAEYERTLKTFFGASAAARGPLFDFMWLGLGEDGHTASLFPGSGLLLERRRWVKETSFKRMSSYRLTLTFPIINRSREIIFVCSGAGKASVLAKVFSGPGSIAALPARGVRPKQGRVKWVLDREAASLLPDKLKYMEVG